MDAPAVTRRIDSRQLWFVALLLLLFAALSVQYTLKTLDPGAGRSAFIRWRDQILSLDGGEDIYQRFAYPNPPIMALILEPLAELPPLVGALTWFYLKVGMALASLYWVFRLVEDPDQPFPPWAKALAALLSLRPIVGDLSHGNVNLFILFLIVGGVYAYHRGRDWVAGGTLALAIACKVTPALFVPYLLWKRSWKALGGCAVGLLLFLVVVPSVRLGFEQNLHLLTSWRQTMVDPYLVGGEVTTEHQNQSLPGLVFRLATHSPSFLTYQDDKPVPVAYHNLISLEPRQARWLVQGSMALFAGLIVWTCRAPNRTRQGWRFGAELSLVVLGMLLFSERTWKHHCVTLLLPFTVLAYFLATQPVSRELKISISGGLALVVVLMTTTSTSLMVGAAKLAQVYGAYVIAYVILVALLAAILRQPDCEAGISRGTLPVESSNRSPVSEAA